MSELDVVKAEVKGLAKNLEQVCKTSKEADEFLSANLNDLSESVDEIKTNHLVHIKSDIVLVQADVKSTNKMLKIIEWGMAGLGLMIALFGILVTIIQVSQ
jgi:hypothetical protein